MKKSHGVIILLIAVFGLHLVVTPAWAGKARRHRWEGVFIGISAAVLGHAIFKDFRRNHPQREVVYRHPPNPRYKPHYRHRAHGYWEVRRKWIPPTFERVWNPGHYDRKGRWVTEQWIEIEKEPGYWTEERVWISKSHRQGYFD